MKKQYIVPCLTSMDLTPAQVLCGSGAGGGGSYTPLIPTTPGIEFDDPMLIG